MAYCIRIERRDPPVNDLDTDLERMRNGEICLDELIGLHGYGNDGYRIAKMMDSGELPSDRERSWKLKVSAACKGNRDAIEEVLSSPRNDFEDPTEFKSDRYRVVERLLEGNKKTLRRMEGLSKTDGCVAASFAMYCMHMHRDEGFDVFCGRTDPSFEADMAYA